MTRFIVGYEDWRGRVDGLDVVDSETAQAAAEEYGRRHDRREGFGEYCRAGQIVVVEEQRSGAATRWRVKSHQYKATEEPKEET